MICVIIDLIKVLKMDAIPMLELEPLSVVHWLSHDQVQGFGQVYQNQSGGIILMNG